MQRLIEILLGLDRGFLSRQGEFSIQFNPHWPGQTVVGAGLWNFLLIAVAVLLVIYVYRREGRTRPVRITLGIIRSLLLAFVIALLNRPVLTLGQSRTEASVLPIIIDDSVSMSVPDAANGSADPKARIAAVADLLTAQDQKLLKELVAKHEVRIFPLDTSAQEVETASSPQQLNPDFLAKMQAQRQTTQVERSIRAILEKLQGQHVAGVVVLTDGRDTPQQPVTDALAALKDFGVKVYPIPIGSDKPPQNIEVQSVSVQDSAFKGDIVNVRAWVRGIGYEPNHPVLVTLKDKKTGRAVATSNPAAGTPGAEARAELPDEKPVEVELQFKPEEVGTLDLIVEAQKQPGEVNDQDNSLPASVAVLDAKITALYVDGYPRWEYRYIKNEMIRDKTVDISCLLTSADPSFRQEGDIPITRFPESIEELMSYDVVIFGDVDPRQFSDAQLQLVSDFVSKRGGGFGMVAGTRFSPAAYRNTAIEALLPVNISKVDSEETRGSITQGFRPVLTKAGADSSIFRFYADKSVNEKFLRDDIQPIFWYCRGVATKQGVGEVYAEHPSDMDPDGRHRAPLLVFGHFGAGRTMFSGIDDSWRWRFYTGESVFDTYWIQQLRYLARSKKLGQRRLTFTSARPTYELGEQVRLTLRVLDPQLIQQLPDQVRVDIQDATNNALVGQQTMMRIEGSNDTYNVSFTADHVGKFTAKLPPIAAGVDAMDLDIPVTVPKLELSQPQVDRAALMKLVSVMGGQLIEPAQAATELPKIPSAAKVIPIETSQPLWDAPVGLILFVLLITTEWVVRKVYGML
jgi:uncharacterized membrane protein